MSVRSTAYVAAALPKGAQKRKVTVCRLKWTFLEKKSATKFLCVKTFSGKVVRHSLAYPYTHGWWETFSST